MSTVRLEPIIHHCRRENPKFRAKSKTLKPCSVNCYSPKLFYNGGSSFCNFKPPRAHTLVRASSTGTATVDTSESTEVVVFKETYPLKRMEAVEGKIYIRLDNGKDEEHWQLTVGCTIPGKWILHWGVTYLNDVGSEWDQPPVEMRPPGSIPIKDYAIETPLNESSSALEEGASHEVKIDFKPNNTIAAINFVLKDEENGAWYQHRGRDFKVPLADYLLEDSNIVGANKGIGIWPEVLGLLSNMLLKEGSQPKGQDSSSQSRDPNQQKMRLRGFYEEQSIIKKIPFDNSVSVSVSKCPETTKNLLYLETDLPGSVVVHWGVCRDDNKRWEIPSAPHPPGTEKFKKKAMRTLLQPKEGGNGSQGSFTLDEELVGFLFVLKLDENTWLRCMGNDFFVPLSSSSFAQSRQGQSEGQKEKTASEQVIPSSAQIPGTEEENQVESQTAFTDGIINEIRNLVSDIGSEKTRKTKSKLTQESILQEIEKLAAEAYSIFRSSIPTFSEVDLESEALEPPVEICSGTGSGFEVLCQGFNWESHKSGRWYLELKEKAAELSSLGFTVIWLPPPTDSVSPEGYMPTDLYNLNSRYGNVDELKILVNTFHKNHMKVLGDAVLNHRCAQKQNQNGVWNIFGGRLNWDDRAVVADDPHFQGRGNKSSGDNFHAAPNIDHSQEFVRKDLKEWLRWMRKEIGYDGWRLDFVRGFWGGYVKDYLDASEPYFAVGEYWDSLSYTYGEMDHNQDAHRQRIVDWINATSGTAGAFDVTTKGILHAALERCEYWRLSDSKGKPPGVVGWWPSRAVTFIENHDTGSTQKLSQTHHKWGYCPPGSETLLLPARASTLLVKSTFSIPFVDRYSICGPIAFQGHWRFPRGKEMQGYAYILTHPGTPAVFFDHIFSDYKSQISALISIRNRNKIHCRSIVKITKVERDVYAAIIDDKVAMKIGPGHYEPPSGPQKWSSAHEGRDYKVWEAS